MTGNDTLARLDEHDLTAGADKVLWLLGSGLGQTEPISNLD
jgi:hypothetical protein